MKTSNSKFSLFCLYLKLSLCAFTLILPARVTNVHAAMTVCSCCIPVAPSPPICNIVGKAEYFENIELTCRSEEGTPTPAYKWQSYNVNNNPRQLPLKATDGTCVCDAAQIHAERYGVKSVPHILANESIENVSGYSRNPCSLNRERDTALLSLTHRERLRVTES